MKVVSKHIVWQDRAVSRAEHHRRYGHPSFVLWFTGLSGAGKSTLARAVERELFDRGWHTYLLDGDNVRHGLNRDLGFSPEDRRENIRRIGEVAKLFVDAGIVTLTAFISPFREDRERVRALFGPGEFVEVYVRCDLATCEARDPKGLYKKARAGEIREFTGIDSPYEPPEAPELVVDTAAWPLEECVARIVGYVESRRTGRDGKEAVEG
ncbi:MAG: adenylyl-sulfate kinase [Candidatus Dadabacteria bacterium]|nr:MAG: adenylyl-sulfate kinase [Candidatus Dadabacteria bacterium]